MGDTIVKLLFSLFILLLSVTDAWSKDVGGITLPEQVNVGGSSETLQLNGAGIRKKFFFSIYVAALYMPEKTGDAEKIINADVTKRVLMHFVYSEVEKEKMRSGWDEGFSGNRSADEMKVLRERLDNFNAMFDTLHEGDVVLLDYLPGVGTRVTVRGEQKGMIPGADFNQALMSVWLGASPVTSSLKSALLGN
ncbi:MAG: hypothetical protein OI74_07290 [Gammaproteobacteria bacterium (ex Lamellibrachia satsuma)]|nr:MAG: chalcone isomerase family protein [Gammaproteobacteria bacterium (ex Lamellibrachia satsuma)]RRS33646.1 MAG: hypothetical protein OI74_07290 [Gammaproteobacteria bacterium (ex Lamellibrachia satsuma)]RRS37093.1 MAG: hypothetical protein NV67_03180 [Gammaproteobacteria bacterium (ex Lamellibrachia satsuma)]